MRHGKSGMGGLGKLPLVCRPQKVPGVSVKIIDNFWSVDFHGKMFSFLNRHQMVASREEIFRWNGRIAKVVTYYTAAHGFCFDIDSIEDGATHRNHSKRRQKVETSEELWTAAVQHLRGLWGMSPSDDFQVGEASAGHVGTSPRPHEEAQPRWIPATG